MTEIPEHLRKAAAAARAKAEAHKIPVQLLPEHLQKMGTVTSLHELRQQRDALDQQIKREEIAEAQHREDRWDEIVRTLRDQGHVLREGYRSGREELYVGGGEELKITIRSQQTHDGSIDVAASYTEFRLSSAQGWDFRFESEDPPSIAVLLHLMAAFVAHNGKALQ